MSTVIDQRVAELRFDNAHFEKNVSQSLSTLEKLKQKLNLSGASKGLEDVGRAAKNVNMDGLGRSAETVGLKFNAMYTMADQALRNITTRVQHTAESVVKAFTIDPVKTGFSEYETQINAIQTILANTQSKGTTLDNVNDALDELNKYADMTIYNFTEMTRNIGTFTAAGVDLDTSVNAIKGIANLAAVSGSTSQQASTAMYQLSQALASGTVKLMDWNSVVNAGMGGQVFQDALKETARVHGIAIDSMIEEEGSFRETLSKGWLSSEILTDTLQKFTLTTEGLTEEQIKANREMLKAKGYTEDQIDEIFKLGATATDAATKVKTFTQLWDVLKEAAQSGWTQTWELLVGDFEQAKSLLTPLSDFFTGIINKTSEWRNAILKGALTVATPFTGLMERINSVTGATEAVVNATKDYGAVVDKVFSGEYDNGQARWDKLTEEGYDWAKVQNMINEKLGCSVRHTEQLTEAQAEQNKTQATTIDQLVKMSDAKLKDLGFTKEEIEAFRELEEQSKRTGIPIEDLIKDIDQLSGRSLLLNSFKNIGQSLIGVFTALKDGWHNVFPPKSVEERSKQLYNMIAALHKFTEGLKLMDKNGNLNDTGEKLQRTFRGIAAAIKLVLTVVGGPIKIAFKALTQLLGAFDLNILDVTAAIGDAIYKFNEWVDSSLDFTKVFKALAPYVEKAAKVIGGWFDSFKNSEIVKTVTKYLESFADNIKDAFDAVKNGDFDIAKDIVSGLVKGLLDGAGKVWDAALELGKSLLRSICDFLGIHSPSTKFIEVGKNIIDGLIEGLQNGFSKVWETITGLGQKCVEVISNIDFGKIFAIVASVALIGIVKKIGDVIDTLSGPIDGISDILSNTADVIGQFQKTLKAFSMNIRAKAIKNIAIALAILVGSVIALTFFDPKELWNAVGVVAALAVVLGVLAVAAEKMSNSTLSIGKDGLKKSGFNYGIISIGASLLLLAATVKMIGNLNPEQAKQGFLGLAGLVIAIGIVFAAYGKLVTGKSAMNIDKAGIMMTKMAGAMLLMTIVAKLIARMDWVDIGKAGAFIGGFVVLVALLATFSMIPSKNISKIGPMMTKIAGALLLMVIVAKLIAGMELDDMKKAAVGIGGLIAIIALLTLITKLAGGKLLGDIGDTLIKIAGAMAILTIVAKMVAGMSWDDMDKAAVGLLGLAGVVAILVAIVKSVEKDAPKIAGTLLALSLAMGILAGVAIVMSLIDLPGMLKGLAAITVLGLTMAAMIKATNGANDVKGSIIAMAIAIGVMAAAAAILTLIDPVKLATSSTALATMMLTFAQIAKNASGLKGSMGSLIVMTAAVGLMATAVYILAKLPVESVLGTAAALSVLMLSLAASFKLISGPSFVNPMTLATIGVLTIAMAALGGILYLLRDLPVESTITNAIALSGLLLALSGCCVILGAAGTLGPAAFVGVGALVTLIAAIGGLIVGIGALADKFPQLEEFMNKGIPILEKIGYALGSFFGNIIGGFMGGITDGLPKMAANLSTFMTLLTPFIVGAKMIDETALSGVASLAKMIALISGAEIINGIASFITGGSSMDAFSAQINKFGDAIIAFSNKVKGNIDESSVLAAANAGKLLAEMQSSIQGTGGVIQWFAGEKDLSTFATQIKAFGEAIVGFSQTVSGNINEEAVMAAANAGSLMTELQNKVAPTGGVVQWFTGEKDMATFGAQLTAFGEAIVGFSNKVKEGVDEQAVTAAATAGSIMTELQSKITPTGGVVQWFCGEQNLETFGTQLKAFGVAMVDFSKTVSGNIDDEAVAAAAKAGEMMVTLQKSIPEDKWFDGKVSLDDFGATIKDFGGHIKGYSEEVTGINVEAITSSISAVKELVNVTKSLKNVEGDSIENFKANKLGSAIKGYNDKVSGLDSVSISVSINAINRLINVINSMAGLDASGVGNFKKAIDSLSKVSLKDLATNFSKSYNDLGKVGANIVDYIARGMNTKTSSLKHAANNIVTIIHKCVTSRVSTFQQLGITIMSRLTAGINSGKNRAASAMRASLSSVASSTKAYYTTFYNAGTYLVDGFAAGISARTWKAEAKAAAMARAAANAAEDELDINSPSKVFRAIAYSVPEGFAMGIDKMSYLASDSATAMAGRAISGVKDAISRISDYMNGDMDSQPTIRPVVDLSEVKTGVNAINGMFGSAPTVGVISNVNSISSMMNQRNQNGANGDIISELGKLRNALGNIGRGNTYNINGITYDDGSAVSDAVSTLIRATLIEGRA